jgi:hypothetical protein
MDSSRSLRVALAAALALAAPLSAGAPAAATLLVYEPFDYGTGTVLDGVPATGLNLAGSYSPLGTGALQQLVVESPGLDYGNLGTIPPTAGNRLSHPSGTTAGGAIVAVDQDVRVGPGEGIFWSALLTLDDSTNANRLANITFDDEVTGDSIGFGEPAVGSGGLRVFASTAATGGLIADGADDAFVDGHTVLLIGRYLNSTSAGGDRLELLVYDTTDSESIPPTFDPSSPGREFAFALSGLDIDLGRITSIRFTIRGDANNFIDELRIGSTYAAVVPEPGVATLLLSGLAALGAGARARRRRER